MGTDPIICNLVPVCHTSRGATCNPATGTCDFPAVPNGAICEDGVCCNGTCCDGCCGRDGRCGSCLVFLSSTVNNGNLGGLTGADGLCQELADSATPAPLPGTYKAWLATGNGAGENPLNRFRRSQQPYRLPDTANTKVADNWDDLTICDASLPPTCLAHPIDVTENGDTVQRDFTTSDFTWTNTGTNGDQSPAALDCADWSSGSSVESGSSGQFDLVNPGWTDAFGGSCADHHRFYCFQQS